MPTRYNNEDLKLQITKVVIQDFVQRGPGFSVAEKILLNKIGQKVYLYSLVRTCQNYNMILSSAMREAIRQMEMIIHKKC